MDNIENDLARAERMERPHYFEDLGSGHDGILRCKDCQKIVHFTTIQKLGMCDGCGNRRFVQINLLQQDEWDKIQSGEIDFEHRDLFIAEFSAVAGS